MRSELSTLSSHPLYFAYGSNLDESDWLAFCKRSGSPGKPMQLVSTAVLPDMALCFDYYSFGRAGGALNITPRAGHIVQGVIFEPDEADWALLDRKEGAPACYRRTTRTAILPGGETVAVQTYEVVPNRRQAHTPPAPGYLEVVHRGLARWNLPSIGMERAAKGLAPEPQVSTVFSYGTLMRGESRALDRHWDGILSVLSGVTHGRLMRTEGPYPALLLPRANAHHAGPSAVSGAVRGECYQVSNIESLLPELDRIEGFRDHTDPSSLFLRTIIEVDLGEDTRRQSWCYIAGAACSLSHPIPSGDWRQHTAS